MAFDWRTRLQLWTARILVKIGRLTHSDYTKEELNALFKPHLPINFDIDVPGGTGLLTIMDGEVTMPADSKQIHVQLICAFEVTRLSNPLYRGHLIVTLVATPAYCDTSKSVFVSAIHVDDIRLVNDEYALISDTRQLLSKLVPVPMQDLLVDTVRSTMGFITGGGSDAMANYLRLYLSGSKQKILDYHKPQITALLSDMASGDDLRYELDDQDWQEHLFRELGKDVIVEDGMLRFRF